MSNCVMCGSPLPSSHRHRTCSMCYGDMDYGTDGYYQRWAEEQQRRTDEARQQDWPQPQPEADDAG